MQVDDATLWEKVLGALAAGTAGLVAWLFKSVMDRITALEKCSATKKELKEVEALAHANLIAKLSREEFKDYTDRAERSRQEIRESVGILRDKLDEVKTIMLRCTAIVDRRERTERGHRNDN